MAGRFLTARPISESAPATAPGEAVLRDTYARVVQACEHHGLSRADGEDLAQDFLLWLLLHPDRSALLSGPALGGVIRIYLMRYRRRAYQRRVREAPALTSDFDSRGSSNPRTDETTLSVRALETLLPTSEALVLRHLRTGATWVEAATAAGIPPGSRDWLRKRMAGHIRSAFRSQPAR